MFLGIYLIKIKNKKPIHYAFLGSIISTFIWSFGTFLIALTNNPSIFFVYFYFIGICFIPVAFLFLGLLFAYTKIEFNWKYKLLFVFPIVDYLMVITNEYHHLFFIKYSHINALKVCGVFYYIHTTISYIYILIGIVYLLFYSIKNAGIFSRQSLLIVLGSFIPLIFNIFEAFRIFILPVYITPVAFSFSMICFALAIFKFDFLNIVPIALRRIVDLISDGYLVINEDLVIIDYNQTLLNTFSGVMMIKRKEHLFNLIEASDIQMDTGLLKEKISFAKEQKKSVAYEENITGRNDIDKHFHIEITPIYTGQNFLGTIILFKDISEHKKNIEIIKHNQEILMEQERMASLGHLIGGIAHNLRTPIMSLAGGIEALKDLTNEYKESIADSGVTPEDHYEIAEEMQEWLEKMRPYCSYMTDIISAVKGQAVQMSYSGSDKFTVEELVKRIDVLMKHELKKYHCIVNNDFQIDLQTEIRGELNSLVQVFDNLIMNAIQAYEGKNGIIDFHISQKDDKVEFIVKDYGKGIPKEIQTKLFKEMITTKGKNGTGLGMYMSYSAIKGRFSGNIRFETEENHGTTFIITIPCINKVTIPGGIR
jgi:signal transduction histidine kinase